MKAHPLSMAEPAAYCPFAAAIHSVGPVIVGVLTMRHGLPSSMKIEAAVLDATAAVLIRAAHDAEPLGPVTLHQAYHAAREGLAGVPYVLALPGDRPAAASRS